MPISGEREEAMPLEIVTNNRPRPILYPWDIPAEVWKDHFAYHGKQDAEEVEGYFFEYKGWYYDVGEFCELPDELREKGWDSAQSDTFFSGVCVRYPVDEFFGVDYESIIVGSYYSKG